MNRQPATTIKPIKPSGILPPIGARKPVFQEVFAAAKAAFGDSVGMTCIDRSRAFFQITGDLTLYSVAITAEESAALGYVWIGK